MTREPFRKIRKTGEAFFSGIEGLFHVAAAPTATSDRAKSPLSPRSLGTGTQLTIREFMTHEPVITRIYSPLHQALELMIARDLSALPVLDGNDRVVGLLNERHLLSALGDVEATTISEVMDTMPTTVGVDEPLVEAIDRLMAINVRQVLVLEEVRLVGVVTRADLMPAIVGALRKRARRAHRGSLARH